MAYKYASPPAFIFKSPEPSKIQGMESELDLAADGNSLLTEDAFSSERSQKLFEAIDELQSCGANRDIDLPELVIVGDQSAGKSSLLQSLTDIPFPVAGRLCTRFPTRIVSRRTPGGSEITRISIEATFSSPFNQTPVEERQLEYAKFDHSSSKFTATEFLTVVEKATSLMGIAESSASELGSNPLHKEDEAKHFSSDILRVEISGPNRSYFSILDLPGVFQSLTKNLTAKEKKGVRDLVSSHMIPKQSVIVCVASGTNDLANQAIFDMASQHDPQGERTVGVITKCDATQHASEVLQLAQNQEKHFNHGWFVVRNRTPDEVEVNLEGYDRDKREEDFFNKLPWNALPKSRRGVQALRKYLTDLLCTRIQMGFPSMRQTIQARRLSAASQLEVLGESRETIEQKRAYLLRIAQSFHSQALSALNGRYGSIKSENMKLRKAIRDANDVFMQEMKKNGHLVPFADLPHIPDTMTDVNGSFAYDIEAANADDEEAAALLLGNSDADSEPENMRSKKGSSNEQGGALFGGSQPFGGFTGFGNSQPFGGSTDFGRSHHGGKPSGASQQFGGFLAPNSGSFSPGQNFRSPSPSSRRSTPSKSKATPQRGPGRRTPKPRSVQSPSPSELGPSKNSDEVYLWIRKEVDACRGTELQGTLNPDVLAILFHNQASKWRNIAISHFQVILRSTTDVLKNILEDTARERITRERIWPKILEAGLAKEAEKTALLNDRMDDLTTKHLQTNNSAFVEKVAKARLLRFQAALYRYQQAGLSQQKPALSDSQLLIDLRDTSALFSELHMSNSRNLENEIHDTLKAYYEIARDEFVEFVTQLVVEKFLDSQQGPVLLFSPMYVAGLSDEAMADLAGEDEALVRERQEKEATLARLRRAEKIASSYS